MQHYNGLHSVTLLNLFTNIGLSILLNGIISLPNAISCDEIRQIPLLLWVYLFFEISKALYQNYRLFTDIQV